MFISNFCIFNAKGRAAKAREEKKFLFIVNDKAKRLF